MPSRGIGTLEQLGAYMDGVLLALMTKAAVDIIV